MIQTAENTRWTDRLRCKTLKRPLPRAEAADATQPRYEWREGAERFLVEHPELLSFLYETGDKLRGYFGSEAALAVERFVDPESAEVPDELFLRVKTPLDVEEARERLTRFEEDWWFDNLQRGSYLLNVSLEFV